MKIASIPALLCACAIPFASLQTAAAAGADSPRTVANGAARHLVDAYVFPARARRAANVVRTRADEGAYDGIAGTRLAEHITRDLAAVLHDKHVRVSYAAEAEPPDQPGGNPGAGGLASRIRFGRSVGYGLGRIAHLPGNVGYVDVRGFIASPEAYGVIDAMMDAVAWSDAIVLDLRRNHGGDPRGIARLLSHLLPARTHLSDFVNRDGRVDDATFTNDVPGSHVVAPVYVLTSTETFSAGEECAYDLQALRRATLVGETTGGGANPGGMHRIDDHFAIFVPTERARNPITHTNWEGTGVRPDVAVPRDRALEAAYARALDARPSHDVDPAERDRLTNLRRRLAALDDAQVFAL